jgi:hypothetical protein
MNVALRVALGLTLIVALTGCGRRTDISGTITRDGKPLVWKSEGGHLLVLFVPENRSKDGEVYRAETNREAGTYRVSELKAGKYLVAIHQFDERHQDALGNKYDPHHSPLRCEVLEDGQVIDFDLPKNNPR